jgi:hypothetical protein
MKRYATTLTKDPAREAACGQELRTIRFCREIASRVDKREPRLDGGTPCVLADPGNGRRRGRVYLDRFGLVGLCCQTVVFLNDPNRAKMFLCRSENPQEPPSSPEIQVDLVGLSARDETRE